MGKGEASLPGLRNGMRLEALVVVLLVAGIVVSLVEGTPRKLPGVALGSSVLLHLERAAAVLALAVAVVSVLAQAARGRLPTQLSTAGLGLAYEAEAAAEAEAAVEQLQQQIDELQEQIRTLADLTLAEEDDHVLDEPES